MVDIALKPRLWYLNIWLVFIQTIDAFPQKCGIYNSNGAGLADCKTRKPCVRVFTQRGHCNSWGFHSIMYSDIIAPGTLESGKETWKAMLFFKKIMFFMIYVIFSLFFLLKINLPWSFPISKLFHLLFWVRPFTMIDFFTRLFIFAIFSSLVNKSCTLSNFVELARTVAAPNQILSYFKLS